MVIAVKALGLYDRDAHVLHKSTLDEVPALIAIASIATLLVLLAEDLLVEGRLGREQGLFLWLLLLATMMLTRSVARKLARRSTHPERCLLIGNAPQAARLEAAFALERSNHATLVGRFSANQLEERRNLADPVPPDLLNSLEVERVILAPDAALDDEPMFVIRELRDAGVKVSILPDVSRLASSSFELDHLGGTTLLGMRRFAMTRSSTLVKRSFDIALSLSSLLVLAPLLASIALLIRRTDGPALFRQQRIGRNGSSFEMLKFRTMHANTEDMRERLRHLNCAADGFFKIADDPRVTRIGRWLRRTKLDELPQLINVLRGDMSIVGPRPLIPAEDRAIQGLYRRRSELRPGITGHWQVLGSHRVPIDEMVKLDYLYVSNWSLWGDIVMIIRTVPLVLQRRGI